MNAYSIYQVKPENIRDYGFCGMRELIRTGRAKVRRTEERIATPSCATARNDTSSGAARHLPLKGKAGEELPALPRERWELVYVFETEKEPSLDWIFTKFQRTELPWEQRLATEGIPEDFEGHSLSVSDIVEDPDGRLWFCDSFGWREVRWA